MPFYQSKGEIPKKRHTVFENPKGGIYYEELVSREGFSYMYSNLYHFNMPTQVMKLEEYKKFDKKYSYVKNDHKPFHFINDDLSKLLLYNKDVAISIFFIDCKDSSNKNIFHKNGDFDALIYIQEGSGILRTNYGDLEYKSLTWKNKMYADVDNYQGCPLMNYTDEDTATQYPP